MSIISAITSFKEIDTRIVQECQTGKWYSYSRVIIFQVEREKYAAVRVMWYEQIWASFLKLWGRDYFVQIFNGKAVRQLSQEDLEAVVKKTADAGESLSKDPLKNLLNRYDKLVKCSPDRYQTAWLDFFIDVDSIVKTAPESLDVIKAHIHHSAQDIKSAQYLCQVLYEVEETRSCFSLLAGAMKRLIDAGYVVILENNHPKFYSIRALQALESVYAEMSDSTGKSLILNALLKEDPHHIIIPCSQHELFELMKPLNNLAAVTSYHRVFFMRMVEKYVEKPDHALGEFLKPVLNNIDKIYFDKLMVLFPDRQGHFFCLLGENLPKELTFDWIKALYKQQCMNFSFDKPVSIKELQKTLPLLTDQVKGVLDQLLCNEKTLSNLCRSTDGYVILSFAVNQISENALIKALPLISKALLEYRPWNQPAVLQVIEQLASDPNRIEQHPKVCDSVLIDLFKLAQLMHKKDDILWMPNSVFSRLKEHPKLPLLKAAYKKVLEAR